VLNSNLTYGTNIGGRSQSTLIPNTLQEGELVFCLNKTIDEKQHIAVIAKITELEKNK
jgi:hypothetical protein